MNNSAKEINKLLGNPEAPLIETPALQQVIAQLEASLTRKENQKVDEKYKKLKFICDKKFQT